MLRSDPGASWQWSDREVAERWLAIFPSSISNRDDPACVERAALALLVGNAERLDIIRERLGSISWFMRALNEPIARMANREDAVRAGFWEGRFKCQALLDEQAVLSCMAYVNLNPVLAGMCEALRDSEHTSVRHRLESAQSATGKALGRSSQEQALKPVVGLDVDDPLRPDRIQLYRDRALDGTAGASRKARQAFRCRRSAARRALERCQSCPRGDPARTGDREPLLPSDWLSRSADDDGRRSWSALDERRFGGIRS